MSKRFTTEMPKIQHVDYTYRQSLQDRPVNNSDCLLVRPLPGKRLNLIRETCRYLRYMLNAIRKVWNANLKRRSPAYFFKAR
ncbi:unnamed protein product [Schistosoma curassoni]|uniref:Transposase n=1 Tax=Schistosoma curassoni TaxID=6186 RepID=A0A183KC85_9TREM|nr:unnamed protein product [Schistosoma curassoni]